MTTHYDLIARNKSCSALAVAIFLGLIGALAYWLVENDFITWSVFGIVLIASGAWSFISYFFSDKMILANAQATPANRQDHFDFFTVTENLAQTAQIPMPKLYVMNDPAPNAFATGRDPQHAVVCATTGLLAKLNRHQLEGVVAHELSHIRHYDILLSSLIAILAGALVMVLNNIYRFSGGRRSRDSDNGSGAAQLILLLLILLAPLLLNLFQLMLSRRREYYADAGSAELTQNPKGLIEALKILSEDKTQLQHVSQATADLYIVDPQKKKSWADRVGQLFASHPPIEDRIAVLQKLI